MDQIKIGRFIATCRKEQNLTQLQLAEKLSITDRAVSKWENGKTMPDSAIMLELCDVLNITVNDLLNGEKLSVEAYNKKTEEKLVEMIQEKEQSDRLLQSTRFWIMLMDILFTAVIMLMLWEVEISPVGLLALYIVNLVLLIPMAILDVKIFRTAGYIQCKHCGHTYVPTKKQTRNAVYGFSGAYMRCPVCNKRGWQKKVFRKD